MVLIIKYKDKPLYVHKLGNIFYLNKKKEGALDELPEGYKIVISKKTGFPYVKRI